ncbi:MAG: hypothetical protein V5B40_12865 [Candidatus Accumulibacter meliphilus]|jgi:hypothetical protein|uniref:hypothetical protein n=1 Tax=Candidatus Accumulibacter meliphilus TaxID=2211374 RepID=UPI002FC3805C
MRDTALYTEWWSGLQRDIPMSIALEEWLRSSLLRVTTVSSTGESAVGPQPFHPFATYVDDEEAVLVLMADLRDLSSLRSDLDATLLRTAVARVICSWEFADKTAVSAIRLSFRIGSIFGCAEVCDELAKRIPLLIASPMSVITGLSDMAVTFAKEGHDLLSMLVAESSESRHVNYLPYLMTRLIESCVRSNRSEQRDLVLGVIERYGDGLNLCGDAIDAIEALTDVFVSKLRLVEAALDAQQVRRLMDVSVFLDDEGIMTIPQLKSAFQDPENQRLLINESMNEASNAELFLLSAGG